MKEEEIIRIFRIAFVGAISALIVFVYFGTVCWLILSAFAGGNDLPPIIYVFAFVLLFILSIVIWGFWGSHHKENDVFRVPGPGGDDEAKAWQKTWRKPGE